MSSEPVPRRQPLFSAPPFVTHSGYGTAGSRVGLVLSGGGVRGAYEVGVVAAVVETLGLGPRDAAPFGIFAGSSVGAINAAFFAGHADRGDLGVEKLRSIYGRLSLREHIRPNVRGLLGKRFSPLGRSVLDPGPLERLVKASLDWDHLHGLIRDSKVRALAVAALDLGDGRTTVFAETSPRATFRTSRDARRRTDLARITPEHVLASAAIPFIFPARCIEGRYFADGGVQFNTPMSPAIRAGATQLLVVTVGRSATPKPSLEGAPGLPSVAARLLTALLTDPIQYELQVLARLNRVLDVIEANVDAETLTTIQHAFIETRGAPYRRVRTLELSPSADLASLAETRLRALLSTGVGRLLPGALRRRIEGGEAIRDADWATYLLFDGEFAESLFQLGRADGLARASDIREFFAANIELTPPAERVEIPVLPSLPEIVGRRTG